MCRSRQGEVSRLMANGWTIRSAIWQLFHGDIMSVATMDAEQWLKLKSSNMTQDEITLFVSLMVDEAKEFKGIM